MIDKKNDKAKNEIKPRDDGVELENQFILRMPEEVAKSLREALQTGNLKDRMTIKLDNELRYGEVRFDQYLLHAKVVDLPTIIECLKTIDNKSFYKSADICQLMICKEEPDEEEKESPNKGKKKDPNKVDKKYLWPHGITAPCKNVRKRRFRKTLKKKNVEAPEIEKEVRRLLRVDNEAVKVEYEVINEDIDKPTIDQNSKDYNECEEDYNDETLNEGEKSLNVSLSQNDINVESDGDDDAPTSAAPISGVGEHDIFGEEVSSSEDEDHKETAGLRDLEETSRLSADDSRLSDFSVGGNGANNANRLKNDSQDFNSTLFNTSKDDVDEAVLKFGGSSSNLAAPSNYFDDPKRNEFDDDFNDDTPQLTIEQINAKIGELRRQHDDLKVQQAQKAQEISSIQNPTLKQRMQETLDNLLSQMIEKELEIKDYENML